MHNKRIIWLIVVALLLIALTWIAAWRAVEHDDALNAASKKELAQQLAVFFEQNTTSTIRYADSYVKMVRREYLRHPDPDAIRSLMSSIPLDRGIASHITIIDAVGTPIYNSGFALRPGTTAADRDYFLHMRDATGDELYFSLPRRGRNSDLLVMRLVRRIELPNGEFGGVLFAALDSENLTEFFSVMALGPKSSATVVGNDKKIRARSSYGRLGPGQDISGSRLWRELERSRTGIYRQVSVVDQIPRYYAYRQLQEFPLIAAIGIAEEDLSNETAGFRIPTYAIATLASVLILTAALLFLRELLASAKLRASEARVLQMNDELEHRVEQRTAELESAQMELLRKQHLAVLGQLTGTVAHELRNPLGTIMTSVTAIQRRLQDSPIDMGTSVERVLRNVARCNAIITELLDFTRVTELELQQTSVDSWVSETLREFEEDPVVKIRCDLNADAVEVEMDRERIRRALINLTNNARDAMHGGDSAEVNDNVGDGEKYIDVSTRCTNERVEIEVRDHGPGIPQSILSNIVEPLFSTKSFGIGLGLPTVKQIMEDHRGGFEIESEEGVGTRATIWLPRQRAG